MTETTFYTLLALLLPNHGYGIMKFVRELTEDRVKMGTGRLYTMLGITVIYLLIFLICMDDIRDLSIWMGTFIAVSILEVLVSLEWEPAGRNRVWKKQKNRDLKLSECRNMEL